MENGYQKSLYLDLMKKCLSRYIFIDEQPLWGYPKEHIEQLRRVGGDWPPSAETMIGLKRLDNIEYCVRDVLENKIPGDLIETGVWRGGAVIFMRAILRAYNDITRRVWVADSFSGVPAPSPAFPQDSGNTLWTAKELAVSIDQVKQNFRRYDMLDEQVEFLPGFFKDTLAKAPISRLAVLRLDGDLYGSTMEALEALYDKVSPGGYIIVDDYALPPCAKAINDFRSKRGITDNIWKIDDMGAFWRKL